MNQALKHYLMVNFAMANLLFANQVHAEEPPTQDMAFFLFLADSIVSEDELITPIDLHNVDVADENETDTEESND